MIRLGKGQNTVNQSERRQYLIRALADEDGRYRGLQVPADVQDQKWLLRGLMNLRASKEISGEFLAVRIKSGAVL